VFSVINISSTVPANNKRRSLPATSVTHLPRSDVATCIHLVVPAFTTGDEAIYRSRIAFFPTPPAFEASVGGGSPSVYCNNVWRGKTAMVWLPDGEKKWRYVYSFRQNTYERGRRTDTTWRHRLRLCIASRGKNQWELQCNLTRFFEQYHKLMRSVKTAVCPPPPHFATEVNLEMQLMKSCLVAGPLGHIMRCDVGLEEREYWKKNNCLCVTILCTIIMV